jgi:Uma2 family endonuclease
MTAIPQSITAEQYLTWEAQQELRYEYDDGKILAVSESTLPHNSLTLNTVFLLRPQVKHLKLRLNAISVKLKVQNSGPYYYPNIVISNSDRHSQNQDLIENPKLIISVLSPETETLDRGHKFRQLRRSETLQEYSLINHESMQVECFRRSDDKSWIYDVFAEGETVRFDSIDFSCPIEAIYEDVNLTPIE